MGHLMFEILVEIVAECLARGEELAGWVRYKARRVTRYIQQYLR